MEKKTKKILFAIVGFLSLLVIVVFTLIYLNANQISKKFMKEFEDFKKSKEGATILREFNDCESISTLFTKTESNISVPPLSFCIKNIESIKEIIKMIYFPTRDAVITPQAALQKCVTFFENSKIVFLPYFIEVNQLKAFMKSYEPSSFASMGLRFVKNGNAIRFLQKYIGSLEKIILNFKIPFGYLEQCISNNTVHIKSTHIPLSSPTETLKFLTENNSTVKIDFKNDKRMDFLLFFMYKSRKSNIKECFLNFTDWVVKSKGLPNILNFFVHFIITETPDFILLPITNFISSDVDTFLSSLFCLKQQMISSIEKTNDLQPILNLGISMLSSACDALWKEFYENKDNILKDLENRKPPLLILKSMFENISNKTNILNISNSLQIDTGIDSEYKRLLEDRKEKIRKKEAVTTTSSGTIDEYIEKFLINFIKEYVPELVQNKDEPLTEIEADALLKGKVNEFIGKFLTDFFKQYFPQLVQNKDESLTKTEAVSLLEGKINECIGNFLTVFIKEYVPKLVKNNKKDLDKTKAVSLLKNEIKSKLISLSGESIGNFLEFVISTLLKLYEEDINRSRKDGSDPSQENDNEIFEKQLLSALIQVLKKVVGQNWHIFTSFIE
ncbi:hypothetical protein CWI36_0634p0010 [Hamiltosporidium magnivora]|uniref:Uncharacterized protein n=1 Tax=Hamiltosporidium magnivora TaxID=148818 RepID=A0A4Q9LCA1_9MICR|nr:hypothetical protein CWI36_0634p0010 [Hamiltosporidium magnivora]